MSPSAPAGLAAEIAAALERYDERDAVAQISQTENAKMSANDERENIRRKSIPWLRSLLSLLAQRTAERDAMEASMNAAIEHQCALARDLDTARQTVDAAVRWAEEARQAEAKLAEAEAAVRKHLCPVDDGFGATSDDPIPAAYVAQSDDGEPIFEVETIPEVIAAVAAAWRHVGEMWEKAEGAVANARRAQRDEDVRLFVPDGNNASSYWGRWLAAKPLAPLGRDGGA